MAWKDVARKMSKGRFVKFSPEEPVHVLRFLGEPEVRESVSTIKGREGETFTSLDFPVEEDGEDRILSITQKSLLRQLMEVDDESPIIGRTLMIKCLDPVKRTNWMIRPIATETNIDKWTGEQKQDPKEKFKAAVRAHAAKGKKKEAVDSGDESTATEDSREAT